MKRVLSMENLNTFEVLLNELLFMFWDLIFFNPVEDSLKTMI